MVKKGTQGAKQLKCYLILSNLLPFNLSAFSLADKKFCANQILFLLCLRLSKLSNRKCGVAMNKKKSSHNRLQYMFYFTLNFQYKSSNFPKVYIDIIYKHILLFEQGVNEEENCINCVYIHIPMHVL